MNRHPIDSTALIFGLLFGLAGMAILIDETLPDIDATIVTGAVVGALGIAFVATLVTRQVRLAALTAPGDDAGSEVDGEAAESTQD